MKRKNPSTRRDSNPQTLNSKAYILPVCYNSIPGMNNSFQSFRNWSNLAHQLTSHGPSQKRLSSARRSVEKASLRRSDADALEELRVEQRKFDDLPEFPDLLAEATDLGVGHVSGVLVGHVVDERIDFTGQVPVIVTLKCQWNRTLLKELKKNSQRNEIIIYRIDKKIATAFQLFKSSSNFVRITNFGALSSTISRK